MSDTDKRTATQKIEDLEKVVMVLYQASGTHKEAIEKLLNVQSESALLKEAVKILNKKTEAIIQVAAPETGITVDSVSSLVVKMNVEDLKAQVEGYVANGHLAATDAVTGNSYLVCEELNLDGSVANPRIQFRLSSQDQATVDALMGKKPGDAVSFGENKLSAKILEVYELQEPKAQAAPAQSEPTAPPAENVADASPAPAQEELPAESPVPVFVPSDMSTAASG